MNKQINNLVQQLSEFEKKELFDCIVKKYGVEPKDGRLRDDIRDKVCELIMIEFEHTENVNESTTVFDLCVDPTDLVYLVDKIIKVFDLKDIEFSTMMEWQTVSDIIQTVDEKITYGE